MVLLLAAVLNLGWVYSQVDAITADGGAVNFSGIVRGATQRLVKQELSGQKSQDSIKLLEAMEDIRLASTELAASVEEQERVSHQQASAGSIPYL